MRTLVLLLLMAAPLWAEDWTTSDGKTYKNVTVASHDSLAVTINCTDGLVTFSLSHLDKDLQQRILSDNVTAVDWTVNKKTYQNVTVGQVEADRVHITYYGGSGTIMLADLPPDLQKKFHYDPIAIRAQQLVKEDAERPDWQRVNDDFLSDLVDQVKRETAEAKTDLQRMVAESHQNDLVIFHNTFSDKNLNDTQKALVKKWAECVIGNQICIGMPKELIPLSWGNPDTDTVSTSGDGNDTETMTYGHWASLIFISGGVIKNITQTQTSQN